MEWISYCIIYGVDQLLYYIWSGSVIVLYMEWISYFFIYGVNQLFYYIWSGSVILLFMQFDLLIYDTFHLWTLNFVCRRGDTLAIVTYSCKITLALKAT